MFTIRNIFAFFPLLTGLAIAANSQQLQEIAATDRPVCSERCNFAFRCDPYYSGPPVWTIIDGVCKLFKTDCLFASTNCHRQNSCLPKLTITSQQICQTKCMDACEQAPIKPVCGVFPYVTVNGDRNDGMITFKNQCELDKWSCWNSKAYISVSEGTCF
ncbi:salivary glue protein Sgs-5 [Bactrocera tryoni]|uniref:salivary glue protein Sgs-5 n=1 Tax=Bactrocera tryoni TaxID=59916 RepID=UPI001A96DE83|nr:salivary glue protein Sgs-5 [Bactrocera tryoni]